MRLRLIFFLIVLFLNAQKLKLEQNYNKILVDIESLASLVDYSLFKLKVVSFDKLQDKNKFIIRMNNLQKELFNLKYLINLYDKENFHILANMSQLDIFLSLKSLEYFISRDLEKFDKQFAILEKKFESVVREERFAKYIYRVWANSYYLKSLKEKLMMFNALHKTTLDTILHKIRLNDSNIDLDNALKELIFILKKLDIDYIVFYRLLLTKENFIIAQNLYTDMKRISKDEQKIALLKKVYHLLGGRMKKDKNNNNSNDSQAQNEKNGYRGKEAGSKKQNTKKNEQGKKSQQKSQKDSNEKSKKTKSPSFPNQQIEGGKQKGNKRDKKGESSQNKGNIKAINFLNRVLKKSQLLDDFERSKRKIKSKENQRLSKEKDK